MTIREASDSDIPAIVELLKISLGESRMPKSEEFWRWKHIENPFGRSPVLLAFEGEKLVGVRAFMRWEWKRGDEIFKAVRAVDTAVHPGHQGKGIFSKLTMQLVEQCRGEGVQFIFNSPNKISMPGYLKLGWQLIGRLPIYMKIHWMKKKNLNGAIRDGWDSMALNSLGNLCARTSKYLTTNRTPEYLAWRYSHNPNVKYEFLQSAREDFGVIYRTKSTGLIRETRIVELLNNNESLDRPVGALQSVVSGPTLISMHGIALNAAGFVRAQVGPHITVRNLSMRDSQLLSFDQWQPSLGDLELF